MTDVTLAGALPQFAARGDAPGKSAASLGTVMTLAVIAIVATAPVPLGSNRPFFWAFWAAVTQALLLLWLMFGERGAFAWRRLAGAQKAMMLLASGYGAFVLVQVLPLGLVTGPFIFNGPAGETFASLSPSLTPGETWHAFLRWCAGCALFVLVLRLAARQSVARLLHTSLAIIVGIHALWGLFALHLFGDTMLFMPKLSYEGVATGTFVNRNSFATFLGLGAVSATASLAAVIAPAGATGRISRFGSAAALLALLVLIMACLFQTQSRMGIVATLAGIAVTLAFFTRRPAHVLLTMLAVLLLAATLYVVLGDGLAERFERTGHDFAQRLALYGQIAGMIMERPLAGYGAGSFAHAYPLFHAPPVANAVTWDHAHSTYLALLLGAGIPAGLVPVILVGMLLFKMRPFTGASGATSPRVAAAIGATTLVAFHSMVDFSLEIQAVALLFVVMLALGSAQGLDAAPSMETGTGKPPATSHASRRPRLTFDAAPEVIYAIGDVHGELDLLLELEARIVADARPIQGEKWIILLGDLIDRGPHSAHVIDHMLDAPPPGFRRFCIAGNHEIMMLKAIQDPAFMDVWLRNGGVDTLTSYGMGRDQIRGSKSISASAIASFLPREHLGFLTGLPVAIETPNHLFVHAGMTPGKPLSAQGDGELTLTGREFLDLPVIHRKVIVHGHHVVQNACYRNNRISIDTGAYLSGRLAAVRIESGGQFHFLDGPSANP